jgi:hypothetical protein
MSGESTPSCVFATEQLYLSNARPFLLRGLNVTIMFSVEQGFVCLAADWIIGAALASCAAVAGVNYFFR